jgi:hypothetical protein
MKNKKEVKKEFRDRKHWSCVYNWEDKQGQKYNFEVDLSWKTSTFEAHIDTERKYYEGRNGTNLCTVPVLSPTMLKCWVVVPTTMLFLLRSVVVQYCHVLVS